MKNSSKLIRIISCLIIMVVIVGNSPVTTFCATSTELQKQKDQIDRKKAEETQKKKQQQAALDAANKKASKIQGDVAVIEDEIEEVDESLVETMASVDIIKSEIADKEKQIEETTLKYEEAKKSEEEQYEAMKLRIRYMYEKGDYTYMQLLMASENFSDMMNKVEYVEKLYDYDRRLLEEYQQAKEETNNLKIQLEAEKDELDSTLLELQEEEARLNAMLEEKQAKLEDYNGMLAKAQKEAAAYRANVEKQNAALRQLEAESSAKQQEIDKAKKAEEEERKAREEAERKAKEEEERRAREESGSSSSSGSGTSSSSGSQGKAVASSGQASTQAASGGSKEYLPASAFSGGSVGENVVQYALQFVGNPYVYGGTSLTNGCDCSGFVFRIYRDFGYSIPRTGMTGIGTEVSYENARAGDIICYAGHVALYMGNGRIVHASTQRTGIKTGNALYKTILTIRRIA